MNRPGTQSKEVPLSKIARRKFIKLSAGAAAGYLVCPASQAQAQDLPQLTVDDPVAAALKYTHDASTVDPAARTQPAADQLCLNCAQLQGDEGDEWRPCASARRILSPTVGPNKST